MKSPRGMTFAAAGVAPIIHERILLELLFAAAGFFSANVSIYYSTRQSFLIILFVPDILTWAFKTWCGCRDTGCVNETGDISRGVNGGAGPVGVRTSYTWIVRIGWIVVEQMRIECPQTSLREYIYVR